MNSNRAKDPIKANISGGSDQRGVGYTYLKRTLQRLASVSGGDGGGLKSHL